MLPYCYWAQYWEPTAIFRLVRSTYMCTLGLATRFICKSCILLRTHQLILFTALWKPIPWLLVLRTSLCNGWARSPRKTRLLRSWFTLNPLKWTRRTTLRTRRIIVQCERHLHVLFRAIRTNVFIFIGRLFASSKIYFDFILWIVLLLDVFGILKLVRRLLLYSCTPCCSTCFLHMHVYRI